MTTIAYHHEDKIIAIDSRTTAGGEIVTDTANKIIENDIGIWFLAGSTCDFNDLVKLNHNDKVHPIPDCSALLIKDGKVYHVAINDNYCCCTELKYNYTLGSGERFATGAMDHGKSAVEAVEYAKTKDIYTGGEVKSYVVMGK